MSQAEIAELIATINDNPSRLHADSTPAVRRLTELGLPAAVAALHLLDDPNMLTRKRAQRVLDGVIMRRHGWLPGQGYADPDEQTNVQALMQANGNYSATAPPEDRQQAIAKWRTWLEQDWRMTVDMQPGDVSTDDLPTPDDNPLHKLERQVERASFYTHTALGETVLRLGDVESFVFGLIDVMLDKQLVTTEEVEAAVARVKAEMAEKEDYPSANVAMRVDAAEEAEFIPVNCAERMPVCGAICCKLHFALSQQEIESGKVKWDLGQPYYIRQEASGFCTHNDRQTGGCGVYSDRPRICQTYSCANDDRIWKDFENMELNHEWLESHLTGGSQPRFVAAFMHNGREGSSDDNTT